jgi:murein DD-endopeptidase MepM/ murein hydrolase activator NlpD
MNLKPQYPLDGKLGKDWKVTSKFGWRIHPIQKSKKHHNGVDIWGPKAKIWIESWHSGKVIFAGKSKQKQKDGSLGGHGWYVDVASKVNGQWYVSRYAHMIANSLTVKAGQKIQAGTRLGIMGTTGASTGKHLHFEILKGKAYRFSPDGKGYLDPLKFVKAIIDNWEIQQAAPQATPDDGIVEPAPVHEPVKAKPQLVSNLKRGSRGKNVRLIQAKLKLKQDGEFGPITEAAVKSFQKRKKLSETGIVDKKLWQLLGL